MLFWRRCGIASSRFFMPVSFFAFEGLVEGPRCVAGAQRRRRSRSEQSGLRAKRRGTERRTIGEGARSGVRRAGCVQHVDAGGAERHGHT
ncbi:hypothetical protein BE18_39865, partial [Sorangium cellulosum]